MGGGGRKTVVLFDWWTGWWWMTIVDGVRTYVTVRAYASEGNDGNGGSARMTTRAGGSEGDDK